MTALIRKPDLERKLDILSASARFDVCLVSCCSNATGGRGRFRDPANPFSRWIYPAHIPGRGDVGILKVLQTNVCKNHCSYCAFSAAHDVERTCFSPEELAEGFMRLADRKLVHGIFISSGVGLNPDLTMSRMVATAEILRNRYRFKDYIHLKVLPGVSYGLIEEAARYANRLSINLEAPTREHLAAIAPEKRLNEDLVTRMRWTGKILAESRNRGKSQTTQFVVGAGTESDLEILKTVDWIYRELYVFRAYFSAFQPADGILAPGAALPLPREHKLYQCDFLLRSYGFRLSDLVFDRNGFLPENPDPKEAYALMHPELFPVDVNTADEYLLLRVPGIGPVSAQRIAAMRQSSHFASLKDLKKTGVAAIRAAPYLLFSGKRDRDSDYVQGLLFGEPEKDGWRTGLEPYQREKLADPSHYVYPAQAGKNVNYLHEKSTFPLRCR